MMEEYLNDLAKRARKSNPATSDDYIGPDGLLHCAVCGEPKETIIGNGQSEQKVSCACRCRLNKQAAEEEKKRKEENEDRRKLCFSCLALGKWRLEDLDESKAVEVARRYVENWASMKEEGGGLLFWGDVGTGKSVLAAAVVNALIDMGESGRMRTTGEIMLELRTHRDAAEYVKSLCAVPSILVIDDLGAERGTDYALETMHTVIDRRYQAGKPLIVTSNVPLEEIKNPPDVSRKRIYDRILSVCVPVQLTGESRRKDIAADRMSRFRALLES